MDRILRLPDHIGISAALGSAGGIIIYLLGGLDQLLTTLLLLIAFDYLSGLLKAIHNKALSSDIGFKGIVRKVAMLVIVALSYAVGSFTGEAIPLREVTIMFFVAQREAWNLVSYIDVTSGQITFACDAGAPSTAVPIQIQVIRGDA